MFKYKYPKPFHNTCYFLLFKSRVFVWGVQLEGGRFSIYYVYKDRMSLLIGTAFRTSGKEEQTYKHTTITSAQLFAYRDKHCVSLREAFKALQKRKEQQ